MISKATIGLASGLVGWCGLAGSVSAQSFVVPDGTTVGQQVIANPGDSGLVLLGGVVATVANGQSSVRMLGATQSVEIRSGGLIRNSGDNAFGVFSQGGQATIANDGEILVLGNSVAGIASSGADASLTNSGIIIASGAMETYGIVSLGASALVVNSGAVTTAGLAGIGILSNGPDSQIGNLGMIATSGDGSVGVLSDGANAVFINEGQLSGTGAATTAVLSVGDDALIVNAGEIDVSGIASTGILSTGAAATIVNSGSVFANLADTAILIAGDGALLDLWAGSAIQGGISFSGVNDGLIVRDGLNTALTFSGNPAYLDTGGNPYVVSGDTLAVVDPSGFDAAIGAQDILAAAVTDAVSHRIRATKDRIYWFTALGALRTGDRGIFDAGYNSAMAGFVTGADWRLQPEWVVSLFGGGTYVKSMTLGESHALAAANAFLGGRIHWERQNAFVDVIGFGGGGAFRSDRRILNNSVLGGIEHARADFGGYFWNAALHVGKTFVTSSWLVTPSLRARYLGSAFQPYVENGSAASLDVASRNASIAALRGEVAFSTPPVRGETGVAVWGVHIGAEQSWTFGGETSAVLLGQPLLIAGSSHASLRGLAGINASFASDSGYVFDANGEVGVDLTGSVSAAMAVTLKRAF